MSTLFISDLHLSGERPDIVKLFRDFLKQEASQAECLYILGDLFEAWLGDDAIPPDMAEVLDDLKTLTTSGVPVYIIVGNRDFLLGEKFAAMTGCKLLPDLSVVNLYGVDTLLMHGDTLCTDDIDYQQFRALVRNPEWQRVFLAKPLDERMRIGREARAESQARTGEKSEAIMDVNPQTVAETFQKHGVTRLIHGHTHRPAIHQLTVDQKPVKRIVLGDWYQKASVLRVDTKGVTLTDWP